MSLCILHNQQLHFNGPYCDYSTHDERDRRQHGERTSLTQEPATMQPHIYHIVRCTTEVSTDPARIAFRSPLLVSSDTSSFAREDASGSPVRLTRHSELNAVDFCTLLPTITWSWKASMLGPLAFGCCPHQSESPPAF
jgi:hypothetical protein